MSKHPLSPGKTWTVVALCAVVVAVAAWVLWPLALGPDPTPAHGLPESDFVEGDGAAGDRDGDGVPDPEDIVASARAYAATRPRYGSAYYEGGPPTDGRGVCIDLLAAALKGAGWDLQSLVDEDIRAAPGAYGVVEPDRAIDYRRVRNVAVFSDHVAVVSDVRDGDGVPYLIHHEGPLRRSFEEDVLASRPDLVGHFRL
ncbi:DUF1287 domain-containing protein [Granulimonas faecalis]|uniref:DUF1287 domain-containing protein n=1 Tax=Granulimonas faecalis TaxID=2894155 RepID=UPI0035184413